jgi:hypothetical protein
MQNLNSVCDLASIFFIDTYFLGGDARLSLLTSAEICSSTCK